MSVSVSARDAIRAIPAECLQRSLARSSAYLVLDLALFGAVAWAIFVAQSWLLALPLAFVLGTILTGIFVIGHDCGHRSFCDSIRINNVVGEVTTALALWPFHVWRLSHDIHHRHTHNIEKDIAWVPFTQPKYERLGAVARGIYLYSRTHLWFTGSWFFTFYFVKDAWRGERSRHFRAADLPLLRRSLVVTAVVTTGYVSAAAAFGGWYGLVFLWLVPLLVFHFWLSTFTLLHHTHSDERFRADGEWTFESQLRGTMHVRFPRWVERLAHDINWHVPHHVCVGIPHYSLRRAHRALKAAFPFVREARFDWRLLSDVISNCHLVTGKEPETLAWRQVGGAADLGARPRSHEANVLPS